MAIKALAWMVRAFEPPVYCYHEIVHNQLVVQRFEASGVVFVDDIAEVPEGSPIMLSAHGSAPEVVAAAASRGGYVVDAVCPLVTKVHHEVKTRAGKGYQIVYVGHEGHEEAVGTMAVAPDAIHRVETANDVADLPEFDSPIAVLAQTTLSHREWAGVLDAARERFPRLWQPERSDLCFATTNRQSALMKIAPRVDAMVVIGSSNSSNTKALAALADLVLSVIDRLAPTNGVEEVRVTDEDEYFPPPRNLRRLLRAIDAAATVTLGLSGDRLPLDDRDIDASEVLKSLPAATNGA